ncbi:MAG: long-chain fatty acid--CoA ligase [Bryobacteraceae bacterium]
MASTPHFDNLAQLFWHNVECFDRDPLLAATISGKDIQFSTAAFRHAVLNLASHLTDQGLNPGDRLAILSPNRPEWHIVDFACHLAGFVLVPLYATLSPSQLEHILGHSGCSAIFLGGDKHAPVIDGLRLKLPALRLVIDIDALAPVLSQPVSAQDEAHWRRLSASIQPGDVATIIYTSGTTGEPKGVMLTHGNFAFDVQSAIRRLDATGVTQVLSILPLAHVFERLFCYGHFVVGAAIAYGDPYDALALLARYRPQVFAAVPRILEKVHETVLQQIEKFPPAKRDLVRWLLRQATQAIDTGLLHRRANPVARLVKPLADMLVFDKIRQKLGGRMIAIVSGGAPLNPDTAEFFYAAGIPIIEGYGLTETSPVIAVNPRGAAKLGRVGPPIEGVEIQFAPDGELLTRGPHVMKGYFQNPVATAQAIQDGWLHTGDLGRLDEDGYLQITGRKKELIVTAYGKNVAHEPIESVLAKSPLIHNAMLIGDKRRYIAALIVPDEQALLTIAAASGWGSDIDQLLELPVVRALYQNEIDTIQKDFADFERVKRFCFIPEAAMQDPEIVTPTMKLRRGHLERRYAVQIAAMYEDRD